MQTPALAVHRHTPASPWLLLGHSGLLAVVYVTVAQIGLLFGATPDFISPVWPLAGIVFVALLRGGVRLWPGVFVGELITGLWLGHPAWLACGIALVTTLEIVGALLLLRPVIGPTLELDSLREVLAFLIATALVSVPLAATSAAILFSVWAGGDLAYAWQIWRAWWIGDIMGILAVAPTVLGLETLRFRRMSPAKVAEGMLLYGALIAMSVLVMQGSFNYAYLLVIFVIWSGLRFGPRGTAVAITIICAITVWLTALGQGPFVISAPGDNLFFLQTFLAVLTVTGLIVSALVAERWQRMQAMQLMADVGGLLVQPVPEAQLIQNVAKRLAVWADGCCIDLIDRTGQLQTVAVAATHPHAEPHLAALVREGPPVPGTFDARLVALEKRQAVLLTAAEHDLLERIAPTEARRQLWAAIRPHIVIMIPLAASSYPIGVIILFSTDRARVFQQGDLQSTQDVADRIVQGITTTRLVAEIGRLQRLEALGNMAGGIAHDFNNLLTIIMGHSDLALIDLEKNSSAHAAISAVLGTVKSAQVLVRELQTIGSREPAALQIMSLNELVRRTEILLPPLLGTSTELVYDLAPDVGTCAVDPGQTDRVIVNLVTNARDAMPEGGRITISTGCHTIKATDPTLPDLPPGPYVWLSLRDTGSGIAPDTLAHIFEPYFTTKAPTKGSGLGLTISYSIVKQLGGAITVHSELGHGTQFVIYLPEVAHVPVKEEPA